MALVAAVSPRSAFSARPPATRPATQSAAAAAAIAGSRRACGSTPTRHAPAALGLMQRAASSAARGHRDREQKPA